MDRLNTMSDKFVDEEIMHLKVIFYRLYNHTAHYDRRGYVGSLIEELKPMIDKLHTKGQ